MEIAFWKDAMSLTEISKVNEGYHRPTPMVPESVSKDLVEKCRKRLPHQVGQVFTNVVVRCLECEGETREMGEYELQMWFQRRVVDEIAKIVGRV